eukprot:Hpha_TRINITY_DN23612_c0_g1::TRINITY_DN23612_c0_g1_i1::g.57526::m.57526
MMQGPPGGMPPGMPQLSQREIEVGMSQTMIDQMHALTHALFSGLDTCFTKCMDTEDIRTAHRREWKEHHRIEAEDKERGCMKACHFKFQKAYSIAMQEFKRSEIQRRIMETGRAFPPAFSSADGAAP